MTLSINSVPMQAAESHWRPLHVKPGFRKGYILRKIVRDKNSNHTTKEKQKQGKVSVPDLIWGIWRKKFPLRFEGYWLTLA